MHTVPLVGTQVLNVAKLLRYHLSYHTIQETKKQSKYNWHTLLMVKVELQELTPNNPSHFTNWLRASKVHACHL